MSIPLRQQIRVGAYILKQRLLGRDKYPLVLMLEPLFRCNLACAGCGKIDYPKPILNRRLQRAGMPRCGRRVRRAGGLDPRRRAADPQGDRRDRQRHRGAQKVRLPVHQRAPGREEDRPVRAQPLPHLLDPSRRAARGARPLGLPGTACSTAPIAAIRLLRARGFRVNVNATLFDGVTPQTVAAFLDYASQELDVEGITVSPGYAYERAPDQEHFLNRRKTKQLFRDIFRRDPARRWRLNHSSLYLDFLAGNQEYRCTPWGNPTRNIFGWQRPCYLLGEGYASSFKELMETTDWDGYGTGNYEKCADCMAHCGYEATAVTDALKHPLKALAGGPRAVPDRGADGARDPARAPAPGRARVRAAGQAGRGAGSACAPVRRSRGPARAQPRGVGVASPRPLLRPSAIRAPISHGRASSLPSSARCRMSPCASIAPGRARGIACRCDRRSARTIRNGRPAPRGDLRHAMALHVDRHGAGPRRQGALGIAGRRPRSSLPATGALRARNPARSSVAASRPRQAASVGSGRRPAAPRLAAGAGRPAPDRRASPPASPKLTSPATPSSARRCAAVRARCRVGAAAQDAQIGTDQAARLAAIAGDDPQRSHMPWCTVRSLRRIRLACRASAQSGKNAL